MCLWKTIRRWKIIWGCLKRGPEFKRKRLRLYCCSSLRRRGSIYSRKRVSRISTPISSKHLLLNIKKSLKDTTQESTSWNKRKITSLRNSTFVPKKKYSSPKSNKIFRASWKSWKYLLIQRKKDLENTSRKTKYWQSISWFTTISCPISIINSNLLNNKRRTLEKILYQFRWNFHKLQKWMKIIKSKSNNWKIKYIKYIIKPVSQPKKPDIFSTSSKKCPNPSKN